MKSLTIYKLALLLGLAGIVGGCAPNPMHKDAGRVSLQCPASHTMVCEANKIGRIRHGTFAHRTDKCACVPDGVATLDSPVIPTIR